MGREWVPDGTVRLAEKISRGTQFRQCALFYRSQLVLQEQFHLKILIWIEMKSLNKFFFPPLRILVLNIHIISLIFWQEHYHAP